MTARDRLFLIVADRASGSSEVEDLGHDVDHAMEIYRTRERELASDAGVEVVLVGSASLTTLRQTHSSYFGASDRVAAALDGSRDDAA